MACPNHRFSIEEYRINPSRTRFMDPHTARFIGLDRFAGNQLNPQSFNKYLYCQADPVNGSDPSGLDSTMGTTMGGMSVGQIIVAIAVVYIVGVMCIKRPTFDFNLPSFPSWDVRWIFGIGVVAVVEMTDELAEKVAEHSLQDHKNDLENLGYYGKEAVADLVKEMAEEGVEMFKKGIKEKGDYLVKTLKDFRTAVRDKATELLLVWGPTGGSIYRPTNPNHTWNNSLK